MLGPHFKRAARRLVGAQSTPDAAALRGKVLDPLVEADGQAVDIPVPAQGGDQCVRQSLAGAPAHVKTRHRIAWTKFAALNPVDDGQKADAVGAHPAIDLGRAARHIGLRPHPGPMVVGAEFAKAAPVVKGEFVGIADALTTLLRRIHKEHASADPLRPFRCNRRALHRHLLDVADDGTDLCAIFTAKLARSVRQQCGDLQS